MKSTRKTILITASILCVVGLLLIIGYKAAEHTFNSYFSKWGNRLIALEQQGLLSHEFGAAWQDVLAESAMEQKARAITAPDSTPGSAAVLKKNGIAYTDYPSLSIIARLNEVSRYANTIRITDRRDRTIATIRTNHTRARISDIPTTLVTALIAAEDERFRANKLGVEFQSYSRAAMRAVINSITRLKPVGPKGTSTITQQVAKLFISQIDVAGRRTVQRSLDRKLREMRLAAAIRSQYSDDAIMEVYVNHCITSDYGLIGIQDIARGLFDRELSQLSDAQCLYLARSVKWGRNLPEKIRRQCRIDMPRMAAALKWDAAYQLTVLRELDSLKFNRPRQVQTDYGPLVDLANAYWLMVLERNGATAAARTDMDLIDPNSLIRKKGNLTIALTIDLPLQQHLERLVRSRGFGHDTTIITDVRIGSDGTDITAHRTPVDTMRAISILPKSRQFSEPNGIVTALAAGDSLITNIRYKRISRTTYRRSCFYYASRLVLVNGQYFAYSIMDAHSGELRAYYSKDRLGSRLSCLLQNRIPNGSSTAKPLLNALCFDLGIFTPFATWKDSIDVVGEVAWQRSLLPTQSGRVTGAAFVNSSVRGKPYIVHNHGGIFDGCQYVFDLLAASNNILGVETAYRLNQKLFTPLGAVRPEAVALAGFLYRINALNHIKTNVRPAVVTGVRAYKELARIVGVPIDTVIAKSSTILSDSNYSVALGTLEINLYEQMHLFNALYNNAIIERPASHPSLVVQLIVLNGDTVALPDTLKRYHPFSDLNTIRPTLLGLHKRLTSNRADGLDAYDIPGNDSLQPAGNQFDPAVLSIDGPLSNFAKSGTTDDVIRPFNASAESKSRTNYGLWNATIRIDLNRLTNDSTPDIRDLTIACVGEGNSVYTGARDGKTMHKFISADLLKRAGIVCSNEGYFKRYERYLRGIAQDSLNNCGVKAIEENQE